MADLKKFIDEIKSLSVLELNELVKSIEEEFGVSAAAPVMMAGGGGAGAQAEEKNSFDVYLASFGDSKMSVIKAIKTITGLGLKESKELVEKAPSEVKKGVNKEEAEKIKATLEEAGATVELK